MLNRNGLGGLLGVLVLGLASACGGDPDDRPEPLSAEDAQFFDPQSDGGSASKDAGKSDAEADEPCKNGTERECKVYLTSHNGIETCFIGVQICKRHIWSVCYDPKRPPADLFPDEQAN